MGYKLRGRIVESCGNYIFNILGATIQFSIVAAPFYILVSGTQSFQLINILTKFVTFCSVLHSSHPYEYEVRYFIVVLIFMSEIVSNMKYLYM